MCACVCVDVSVKTVRPESGTQYGAEYGVEDDYTVPGVNLLDHDNLFSSHFFKTQLCRRQR